MIRNRHEDTLDAEIKADRIERQQQRKRLILYAPPFLALFISLVGFVRTKPQTVRGARVIASAAMPDSTSTSFRVIVLEARSQADTPTPVPKQTLRLLGQHIQSQITVTNDDGVAELTLQRSKTISWEQIYPLEIQSTLDSKQSTTLATVHGNHCVTRSAETRETPIPPSRTQSQDTLTLEVAPEQGAFVTPAQTFIWAYVHRNGQAVSNTELELQPQAGVSNHTKLAHTNELGFARFPIQTIAPPIVVSIQAKKGELHGSWYGSLRSVYGVPTLVHKSFVPQGITQFEVESTSSRRRFYVDLWHNQTRIAGGALEFQEPTIGMRTFFNYPFRGSGVFIIEISSNPEPSFDYESGHAVRWPLVIANNKTEALRLISTNDDLPFHFEEFEAALALTPWSTPPRCIVTDGLHDAFEHQLRSMPKIRKAVILSLIGCALLELILMIRLGVLSLRPFRVEHSVESSSSHLRAWIIFVLTAIAAVVLIFTMMLLIKL